MLKFLALFLILNHSLAIAKKTKAPEKCSDLECWQTRADNNLSLTKDKSADKEIKESALKGLQDACRNLIDQKLQSLLLDPDHKKDLDETIYKEADLAVLRTNLAFLQLQEKFNKASEKKTNRKKTTDKTSQEGDTEDRIETQKAYDKLTSGLKTDLREKNNENAKLLTNFLKFIKGSDEIHNGGVDTSKMQTFLKSLQKISKKSNYDNIDQNSVGVTQKYQMTDADIAIMEQLLTLSKNNPQAQDQNKNNQFENSLLDKTFSSLKKNFGSRNFVQSDSGELRENIRHAATEYKVAKDALAKWVKEEMEKYFSNKDGLGHSCSDYYKKASGKLKFSAKEEQDLCLNRALRESLNPTDANNLEGLLDYLKAKSFTLENDIAAIGADHARTLFTDLKGCKIAPIKNSGGCCEVQLEIYTEHLPGEDDSKAEWFISTGNNRPEVCDVDGVTKFKSPISKNSNCKGNNGSKAVSHGKGSVPHHGPVKPKVQICDQPSGDQLGLFGTRQAATAQAIPINEIPAKDRNKIIKMRRLNSKEPSPEEATYKNQTWRSIDLTGALCNAQNDPCYKALKDKLKLTVLENIKLRKLISATFDAKLSREDKTASRYTWTCPLAQKECRDAKGLSASFKRLKAPYDVVVVYKPQIGEALTEIITVPALPTVEVKITKTKKIATKTSAEQQVLISSLKITPDDPKDLEQLTKGGKFVWECAPEAETIDFKGKCPIKGTINAKLTKEDNFEIKETPYKVRVKFVATEKSFPPALSNVEAIDKYNTKITLEAKETSKTDTHVNVEPILTITADPGAPQITGEQKWQCVDDAPPETAKFEEKK